MKKLPTIMLTWMLLVVFLLPAPVSAATSPGIKPGNPFYFFDTTFEKVSLFFSFNSEKKARKALEYADERLAEAEAVVDNTNAVETAVAGYKSSIAFATKKSKDVKEEEKSEALLTTIVDNTSKHQEVLADVLKKVPDEAKEAITKAIETNKKGHEEALQKLAELKGEVEELKQEVAELKAKDEEREKAIEELSKQKSESTPTPVKTPAAQVSEPTPITPKPTTQTPQAPKTTIVTLPNGAIVEMDTDGNIIRYIKEAEQRVVQPQPIQNTKSAEEEYYTELMRQQEEKKKMITSMTNEYNQSLQTYKECLQQGSTISFVRGNCGGLHLQLIDTYYQLLFLGATNVQTVPALPGGY